MFGNFIATFAAVLFLRKTKKLALAILLYTTMHVVLNLVLIPILNTSPSFILLVAVFAPFYGLLYLGLLSRIDEDTIVWWLFLIIGFVGYNFCTQLLTGIFQS